MIENKPLELYFHIPFCVRKCNYCDFLSAPATGEQQNKYMEALFEELTGSAFSYEDYTVETIFIGGGTPSVVETAWVEKLMEAVRRGFRVSDRMEVTIEVNPGTVDQEKLRRYRGAGINRLSIGLQSAREEELRAMGRIHSFADFCHTYDSARSAGFENINVDLMSALPGQTPESYRESLEKVLSLRPMPEHISAYSLIVEEGTPFYELAQRGELSLPSEEWERLMYEETGRILREAGFHRYEISNYARKGYACRHNCGYWRRVDYRGYGIGAASLIGNTRFSNGRDLEQYCANPMAQREETRLLGREEQMEEFLFLGLRMTDGISSVAFAESFGSSLEEIYGAVIGKNIEDGLLEYRPHGGAANSMLALTERGLDLSNYVMAQFLLC